MSVLDSPARPIRMRSAQAQTNSPRNPDDLKTALEAARSPLKVLNHLDVSARHDAIARRLGTHHTASRARFLANRKILAEHQARRLSTEETIARLAENGRLDGVEDHEAGVRALVLGLVTAAHIEFHPTDACNEA